MRTVFPYGPTPVSHRTMVIAIGKTLRAAELRRLARPGKL